MGEIYTNRYVKTIVKGGIRIKREFIGKSRKKDLPLEVFSINGVEV